MNPLLADPWIAAQIDQAVAPYRGRLPASEVAWMREQLAEVLASDESAARVLRRAHPHPVDESGVVACASSPGEVAAPPEHRSARRRRGA
jgi:hypothetical protein